MRINHLFLFFVFLILSDFFCASFAHADAYVCVDAQGKKHFSNEKCETKKMKSASAEFPVISGQAISAAVILSAPPEPQVRYAPNGGMISKDGKTVTLPGQILMTSDLPLDKPVLYFLMSVLFGTIGILIAFFWHYYSVRRAKLDLFR